MKSKSAKEDKMNGLEDKSIEENELMSYIPKAHVQFLEQSGVRVVPISYLDSAEDIIGMLD
jgi:Pyruvate/2-oxoacid:ferredoxin oxidoreductase gamma subunit